jgi:hypothetical protein
VQLGCAACAVPRSTVPTVRSRPHSRSKITARQADVACSHVERAETGNLGRPRCPFLALSDLSRRAPRRFSPLLQAPFLPFTLCAFQRVKRLVPSFTRGLWIRPFPFRRPLFPLPLQPSANAFVSRWTVCPGNDLATRQSAKTCRPGRTRGQVSGHSARHRCLQ